MNDHSAVIHWDDSPVCLTLRTGSATPKAWHWQTSHPQQLKLWNCRKTTVWVFFQWEYRNSSCNTFLYVNYIHVTILPLSWGRIFFNKQWQGAPQWFGWTQHTDTRIEVQLIMQIRPIVQYTIQHYCLQR